MRLIVLLPTLVQFPKGKKMKVQDYLAKCGYKLKTVEIDGQKCSIVVLDKDNPNPELSPVAIGGKPVVEE